MIKKNIFYLFVLFLSCTSKENFETIKIKEANPNFLEQKYEFPLLKGKPISISKKINFEIIKDFLEVNINDNYQSIFENVWSTIENPIPRISDLSYNVNILNTKIYSITLTGETCGAYCEEFSDSYNFDLSKGNKITLEGLFTIEGKVELLQILSTKKKKIIENHLIKLKTKVNTSNKEDEKYINSTIKLYEYCLEGIPFVSLEYFDFKVINNNIIITSDRCSNHAMRALDELGEYVYIFKKSDLNSFLNDYGIKILKDLN
jgi:hypothetical protein